MSFVITRARRLSSARTQSPWKVGGVIGEIFQSFSEMEVRLQEYILPVGILRINRRDHSLTPRVTVVESRAKRRRHRIVGADVPDVGKAPVAVAGPARVSKGLRLERSSA